jgi:hypothetical protein
MALHIRRYAEIWPDENWGASQFAVLTDEGQQVGTVQFHVEVVGPKKWGWYINGEIVSGFTHSQGMTTTTRLAKTALATSWREYLAKTGKPENYPLPYGRKLSIADRGRLRLSL